MTSPDTLDLAAIFAPVSETDPAGTNLREDASAMSVYYRIKEARASARTAERKAEAPTEDGPALQDYFVPPEWDTVLELVPQTLAKQSKDLELAAWLVEALAREHGFAGLRDGLRVMRGLVERFWDGLWPRPDDEGVAARVAPLAGLNNAQGTLIAPISRIPLTDGSVGKSMAAWHYQKALELSRIEDPERRQARTEAAGVSLESFKAAVAGTPADFLRNLRAELVQCLEELALLTTELDRHGEDASPPTNAIRDTLQAVLETLESVARDKLAVPAQDAAAGAADATGADSTSAGSGALRSRDDAFATLARVAEYFRRAEPHSPLSYLLDQAVRWGRLPLPDLLQELIPDESSRTMYMKLAGIKVANKE